MKRFVKALAIILTVVLFASLASSCGLLRVKDFISGIISPETPIEDLPLEERADKVIENMSSKSEENKSMDVNLKMVFKGMALNGSEFTLDVNGVSNYRYLENGEYQYLQTQTISTILPGETSDVSTHTLGYKNGKMFETSVDGNMVTKVYSELTAEEFKAHMDITYGTSSLELTEEDYVVSSCEKINNKWVTEISIFSEYGVDVIQRELLSDIEMLVAETHTISEIIFTIVADSEFNMTGYEILAEFVTVDEKYNDRPMPTLEFSVKAEDVFSPKPLDEIDFGKYTRVDDLRAFDTVNKALNDKINDDYCEIVSEVKSEITFRSGYSQHQDSEYKYDGYYKNTENGFEFNVLYSKADSMMDYRDVTIDYKNLTQVSNNGSYSQTENYKTDHTARLLVDSMIDPIGITIDGLKHSSTLYDGDEVLYRFEFENAGQALGFTSSSLGASLSTDVATLNVVIIDGELASYSYTLTIEAINGIYITVTANCTYSE